MTNDALRRRLDWAANAHAAALSAEDVINTLQLRLFTTLGDSDHIVMRSRYDEVQLIRERQAAIRSDLARLLGEIGADPND